MARKLISSGSRFEADIGYSRAVVDGDWVFVSGTTGFDYATMTISDDVVVQADRPCATSQRRWREAERPLPDVVRVHYILPDAGGLPDLLAGAAAVSRRRPARRDDDRGGTVGPAHEDRDRSHRAAHRRMKSVLPLPILLQNGEREARRSPTHARVAGCASRCFHCPARLSRRRRRSARSRRTHQRPSLKTQPRGRPCLISAPCSGRARWRLSAPRPTPRACAGASSR